MDEHILTTLGLFDDVWYLFDRLGWRQFMSGQWATYVGITLEFLSYLHVKIISCPSCAEGLIKFQLGNIKHRLHLSEFNQIYDLPVGGARHMPNDIEFKKDDFLG